MFIYLYIYILHLYTTYMYVLKKEVELNISLGRLRFIVHTFEGSKFKAWVADPGWLAGFLLRSLI